MKNSHTPGPWRVKKARAGGLVVDRKFEIVHPDPSGGETVIVGEHTGIDCLREADAHLIAAAPDLLAALEAIVRITDGSQPKDYPGALMVARAAISKAQGEGK